MLVVIPVLDDEIKIKQGVKIDELEQCVAFLPFFGGLLDVAKRLISSYESAFFQFFQHAAQGAVVGDVGCFHDFLTGGKVR